MSESESTTDTVDNPVAEPATVDTPAAEPLPGSELPGSELGSDLRVDEVLASFEKELGTDDAAYAGPAPKMFTKKSQVADHSKLEKANEGCCCVNFFKGDSSAGHVTGAQLTDSVVEFDPIELSEDQLYTPSLIDIDGFEISLDPDTEFDPDEVPDIDEDIQAEDIGHLAVLELQLQQIHEELHDMFDPRNPSGNALKNAPINRLHAEAAAIEKRIDHEKKRINEEEAKMLALAQAAGDKAKEERSASGKAAMSKFKSVGLKAKLTAGSVKAAQSGVNHITIDDPDVSLGIDWHFQGGKGVVAAVREGGSAAAYMDGKVIRPGMVLKSFSLGRTDTEVTWDYIKTEIAKYPEGFQMTGGHCLAVILDHTRPMTLHFQEPGFALTAQDKKDGLKASELSLRLGFEIQDLKYLVPKTAKKLGMKFWKTRHGVALCDIENDSIASSDEFLLEGMRPGLLLKKIISADGFTRDMVNTDMNYTQIMRQVAISARPCVCVFAPDPEPLEFTFDEMALPTASKTDIRLMTKRTTDKLGLPLPFSIFRHLGLSLREEEHGREGSHDWRVRISGILPGGIIDRFNRTHKHAWITPGMTLTTLYSPMFHITDVRGMNLADVVGIFHKCASGKPFTKKGKVLDGNMREYTLDGRSITIGFEVTLRALKTRELVALAHGGHRGETETVAVDLSGYEGLA